MASPAPLLADVVGRIAPTTAAGRATLTRATVAQSQIDAIRATCSLLSTAYYLTLYVSQEAINLARVLPGAVHHLHYFADDEEEIEVVNLDDERGCISLHGPRYAVVRTEMR